MSSLSLSLRDSLKALSTPAPHPQTAKTNALVSTPDKIHWLVVLKSVFIGASFFIGCTSFLLIAVNPIYALGTIPAIAFAALGIQLLNSKSCREYTSPQLFVPGQPLALDNQWNNCWLIASLQLLFNIPSLSKWLLSVKAPESSPQKNLWQPLAEALRLYQQTQARATSEQPAFSLSSNDLSVQKIREDIVKITKDCSDWNQLTAARGTQEDPSDFFRTLITAFQWELLFWQWNSIDSRPSPPTQQPQHFIAVHPIKEETFQMAWEKFFKTITDPDPGKSPQTVTRTLQKAPDVLFVHLLRESHLDDYSVTKNTKPYDVPIELTLSKENCIDGETKYFCKGVISHLGGSGDSGHYVADLAQGSHFWHLNDAHPPKILTQQEYQDALKNGSFFIYEKIEE